MDRFPHLDDTNFPDLETIDVYKYRNEFDYQKYDYSQMHITMCAVPWDMGEAHIGNRTISGIGNVVWFETEAKRDAWFAAIPDAECLRFSTKYRDLHTANYIDLPIPYDVACNYNYIAVEYSLIASDSYPVDYETTDGLRKWFWFIREVEFRGANSTRIHLMIDAWQTFMYRANITGMMLERGHAPMAATDVDDYLEDPLNNSRYLLASDVDYGSATVARGYSDLVFNAENILAVIITTARPAGTWGSRANGDWKCPGAWNNTEQGNPSYMAFCMDAANLSGFLSAVNLDYPQFVQAIKAIAFVSADFVTLGADFQFANTTCHYLIAHYKQAEIMTLTKELFGYPAAYNDVAKLYTSPYAHIELSDENGNTTVVKIEDTRGTIYLESCTNLVFPWLSIDGHITGIGAGARRVVTFAHVTDRSIPIRGNWYETCMTWNIPTFGVYQDAGTHNDYSEFYSRAQATTAYSNRYDSSIAEATTQQANANASSVTSQADANASATTAQNNANASADTTVANTALQTTANTTVTARSNQAANQDYGAVNSLGVAYQAWDAGYANDTVNAQNDATVNTAAIGAAGGMVSSIASGAMSAGPVGALSGAISGAISGATSMSQAVVAVNLASAQAGITNTYTLNKLGETNQNNADRTAVKNSAATDNTSTQNAAATGIAANTSATQKANALRDYTTTTGNAQRDYDTEIANATRSYNTSVANAGRERSTAQASIANGIASADISAPLEFGTWANGEHAPTRPLGLFANIVTESDYAIRRAGDEFLRYGYAYNGYWPFDGNWNICDKFTYWKLSDFWISGLNLPDAYMDRLRFFLFGGVTVWADPADIGNVTIYQNGF